MTTTTNRRRRRRPPPTRRAPPPERARRLRQAPPLAASSAPATGGTNAATFGGGGGDGTLKIGFTAPLTGALAGFGEANPFIVAGIQRTGRRRAHDRRPVVRRRDHREGRPDQLRHRRIRGRQADHRGRRRPDAGDRHPRDDQPGRRPVRGQRRAVPQHAGAVAAVLPRPRWRSGSRLRLDVSLLLGRRSARRHVRRHVEHDRHQQGGRDPVPQRPGRQRPRRCPRPASRPAPPPAATRVVDPGRFETATDDFSAIISEFKDQGVEIVVGIPHPARLRHVLDPGQAAGLQSQVGHDGQGSAVLVGGRGARGRRQRARLRDLVDADPPVHQLAHRDHRPAAGRRVHGEHGQAVDAVRRLRARPVRGVLRRRQPGRHRPTSRRSQTRRAATQLDTIVGPIQYGAGGVPKNVSTTSLVGGQWQQVEGQQFPFDLVVDEQQPGPARSRSAERSSRSPDDTCVAARGPRRLEAVRRRAGGRQLLVRPRAGRGARHRRARTAPARRHCST